MEVPGGLSDGLKLSEQYVFYVMYADFPSGGFSMRPSELYKPAISPGVEAIVNQLLAL